MILAALEAYTLASWWVLLRQLPAHAGDDKPIRGMIEFFGLGFTVLVAMAMAPFVVLVAFWRRQQ